MSSRVLPKFDVVNPRTVAEACSLLAAHGRDIAVLAGGTDMLVWSYIQRLNPGVLLSLAELPGLDSLEERGEEGLCIGARVNPAHQTSIV